MNPVSESRFLPSFLAIAASLVLVCGSLLLLTSTAPWSSRPNAASETSAPVAADTRIEVPVPATVVFAPRADDGAVPASEDAAEADRGDTVEAAEAQPQQAAAEPVDTVHSDLSSVHGDDASAAFPHIAETPANVAEAAELDATQASVADVSQVDETEATAADVSQVDETEAAAEAIAAEAMNVSDAAPMPEDTAEPVAMLEIAEAGTEPAETPPAAETAPAAKDQIGALLTESPPAAIATETIAEHDNEGAMSLPETTSAGKVEAPGDAAAQATETNPTAENPQVARTEVTAAAPLPPPPLPKRKPEIAREVPVQTARNAPRPERASRQEAPKPTETRAVVAQQTPAQSGGGVAGWLPMALAPADKPVAKEPTARLSGQAYSSKVWSALARNKPRAGQSGSATVVFSIGWGGALTSLSIGKSSGNARIDQLALATVRAAAPFPQPPSGPASFSIRIDFH
jgi:protein TonB